MSTTFSVNKRNELERKKYVVWTFRRTKQKKLKTKIKKLKIKNFCWNQQNNLFASLSFIFSSSSFSYLFLNETETKFMSNVIKMGSWKLSFRFIREKMKNQTKRRWNWLQKSNECIADVFIFTYSQLKRNIDVNFFWNGFNNKVWKNKAFYGILCFIPFSF